MKPPREARCHRDRGPIDGCLCGPAFARCRGPWALEVFVPAPADEAKALSDILGYGLPDASIDA